LSRLVVNPVNTVVGRTWDGCLFVDPQRKSIPLSLRGKMHVRFGQSRRAYVGHSCTIVAMPIDN
jgi:hypothetical protein